MEKIVPRLWTAVLLALSALTWVNRAVEGHQAAALPAEEKEKPASDQIRIPRGKENLPAEQVFKNIEILKGHPAKQLPGMMHALNGLLGVGCIYCHVAGAWEKEEPPTKVTARRMFKMIESVNTTYFPDAKPGITCWTCHRGVPKPSMGNDEIRAGMQNLSPERKKLIAQITEKLGNKQAKPADQAYANIRFFKGMPASQLLNVMNAFTIVLGVDCAHCHVEGAWEKDDKKPKQTARVMLRMVPDINDQLFDNEFKVACWTCHHGSTTPEDLPK